ncbi:hypothetical protein AB0469_23200 [Streptomyces sp. NPDC093801]|uniref:hypothetical protein n=1 Tax=Streptomyces sp. NPDC093801 TaxID=3155203 RepID=UPI00344CB86B
MLVGTNGTIDRYCCTHFDSPSVFAAIDEAGAFVEWLQQRFRHASDYGGWPSRRCSPTRALISAADNLDRRLG